MYQHSSLLDEYRSFWNSLDNFRLITESVKWRFGDRVSEQDWLDETRSFADITGSLIQTRRSNERAIVLGIGSGSLIRHLVGLGFVVDAFDVSRFRIDESGRYTNENVSYFAEDELTSRVAFSRDSYDLAVTVNYLHNLVSIAHLEDCLANLSSVLRPGGGFMYQARVDARNPKFLRDGKSGDMYRDNYVKLATANFYSILDCLERCKLVVTNVKFSKNDLALFSGYKRPSKTSVRDD